MSATAPQSRDLEKILAAVESTLKAEPYCFLITLGESGHPQARMVEAARIEPDLRVWMITSPTTRKVKEIQRDNRATMAFSDNKGEGYVTLIGQARLGTDASKKKSLWKLQYEAFYPGGPEGKEAILIEFTPHQIEIMHFHFKIGIWPWTSEPTILVRDGNSWKNKG